MILQELSGLGLTNRGTFTRNSTASEYYPDGTLADYYTVIQESKRKGFPGIIVEHAFISNASDAKTYLSSDECLRKLGVADAAAIARYLEIEKYNPIKQAQDGEWYYYVDGTVDTTYTGLVQKGKEAWYVREGKVDFGYNGLFTKDSVSWYVKNGIVDYKTNGLVLCDGTLYYFKGSAIDHSYNNLASYDGTWYYVKNGTIDWSFTVS